MRFAYIDSQGKEVGIPTVEALQLRIELGAITEETMFYDASKDRWDPAGEHEIFRTLSREVRERGEEGPRPPRPNVPPADEGEGGAEEVDASAEGGDGGASTPRPRAPDPFDKEQDPLADTAPPGEVGWVEVELEDVREASEEPGEPVPDHGGDWDVDLGDFGSLDLAPELGDVDDGAPAGTEGDAPEGTAQDDELDAEGGLEVEPVSDGPAGAEAADATAFEAGEPTGQEAAAPSGAEAGEAPTGSDDELPAGFEGMGGLDLEPSFGEQHASDPDPDSGSGMDPGSDLELERPLSELEPGPGGAWDREGADDDASPGPASAEPRTAPPAEEAVRRERARKDPYDRRIQRPRGDAPRRRRSRPPPRRRRGPSAGTLAAVVALVALAGAGGWFGWSAIRGPDASASPEATLPVLPPLPSELEAAMRDAADSAWADGVDTLRAMAARAGLPAEPDPDWLAGVYLANASDYPDVPTYWAALGDHLTGIRAADEEVFLAALDRRLAASQVPAESRDTVVVRALAGFRAAEPEREVVYERLQGLIDAAVELHEFLVGNQANIAYEPAAGLSRDPVTEAIPSTAELGDEMWDRVGEIPTALDALGSLDRVTSERILDVFHRRLEAVEIR